MKLHYKKSLIALAILTCTSSHILAWLGHYNPTKAQSPVPEPRLEKPWLASLELEFLGGSTTKSRDSDGNSQELLNLYGNQNMRLLGYGVPDLEDPGNILSIAKYLKQAFKSRLENS